MKRLTIHLKNVEKVSHEGKAKVFNTVSFNVKNDAEGEKILSGFKSERVSKHYYSNLN